MISIIEPLKLLCAYYAVYIVYKIISGIYKNFIRPRRNLKKRYSQNQEVWACVTGATDGLGYAFCDQLARSGFNILLVSRSKDKLERVQGELWNKYPNQKFDNILADFTVYHKAVSPLGWFETLASKINEYDVGLFINNAGVGTTGGPHYQDFDPISIVHALEVNTIPYVMLLRYILPKLVERNSRSGVINVTSHAATNIRARSFTYSPTKRFEDQVSHSLAHEFSKKIDMMSVRPLFFSSSLTNLKPTKSGTVLSAAQCASGALDKLGYETRTAGHWMHNLQASLIHALTAILPESIYSAAVKRATGAPRSE